MPPAHQKSKFLLSGQEAVLEGSDMMDPPIRVFTALCHQKMEVDVEIYLGSEGLD